MQENAPNEELLPKCHYTWVTSSSSVFIKRMFISTTRQTQPRINLLAPEFYI